MRKKLSHLLVAVLLPGLLSTASAQQEIKVRAVSFQPEFPVELHAHHPSGSATAGLIEVKSFLNHEANLLKFKGNSLVFTRKFNPVSATDSNEVLAKAEIPGGSKSFLLLFIPETAEAGNFHSRVMVVDDSAKAFPAGSFKVANYSNAPLKIELEKESYEFAPGEVRVISKPPFGDNQSASMQAYSKSGEEWKLIGSGSWPNPGTRRVLQVAFENLESKMVELKGIRDVVVP